MEGPTPVSALIHAATMVTAGVFMVCRLSPMFETAPIALAFVTFIGAATCFFAATVGTTQWDIKRVIAYSTCSQLGYMFFAAGVGAYGAAMFHLFTHAFFKALLFLGAGSVIHAMHHEQDMRYLRRAAEAHPAHVLGDDGGNAGDHRGRHLLAARGLCRVLFEGRDPRGGLRRGTEMAHFAFWVGAFAALLTSFYSWRLMFLTFFGKPRWAASEHIQHAVHDAHGGDHADHPSRGRCRARHRASPAPRMADGTAGYHPHESPLTMLVPLGVLTLGAIAAGFVFHHAFLDERGLLERRGRSTTST